MMTSHFLLTELARAKVADRHREAERARLARAARPVRRRSTHRQRATAGRVPLRLVRASSPVPAAFFVLVVLSGAALTLLLQTAGAYHP